MHRRPDIQLRDVPERSRRNKRDCDRQPTVERRENIYFSTLAAASVNGQKCNVSGGAANPHER